MPDTPALTRRRSDQPERLLKVREAAELCRVNEGTIYRWIAKGWLKAVRLPSGFIRIAEATVRELAG